MKVTFLIRLNKAFTWRLRKQIEVILGISLIIYLKKWNV